MKHWYWKIRYAMKAMRVLSCSPSFAWAMAGANDEPFNEGVSPSDALYEELSYWG